MNASIHDFPRPSQTPGSAAKLSRLPARLLAMRWAALADAGAVAAMLAQVDDSEAQMPVSAALGAITGWRGEMVEARLAELSATMEAGLGALLAMREGGHDTTAAATALWREFAEARGAIRVLLEAA